MLALLYKAQIYFGNYFQKPKYQFGKILQILKAQVLPLAIFFQKPKHQFGKILQILKAQVLSLAIFYQKPKCQFGKTLQILKSPSTILGNILSKAQMLVWQSSIIGNILSKAQILVWQQFYKYSKAQVLPLAIFWKNFTKPKYYLWQYFGKILQNPNANLSSILKPKC